MKDDSCIFCKIASGEAPANKVYEDDYVLAFDDLNPLTPVHTLIIPKDHYASIGDDVPEDVLGKVFGAVGKVAKVKGIAESGYRVLVNTGEDGGQTVGHLHVHVLGGTKLDNPRE
jgi:histidine triad (HIT) family protein